MKLGEQRPWTCGPKGPEAAVQPDPGSSQETRWHTRITIPRPANGYVNTSKAKSPRTLSVPDSLHWDLNSGCCQMG